MMGKEKRRYFFFFEEGANNNGGKAIEMWKFELTEMNQGNISFHRSPFTSFRSNQFKYLLKFSGFCLIFRSIKF